LFSFGETKVLPHPTQTPSPPCWLTADPEIFGVPLAGMYPLYFAMLVICWGAEGADFLREVTKQVPGRSVDEPMAICMMRSLALRTPFVKGICLAFISWDHSRWYKQPVGAHKGLCEGTNKLPLWEAMLIAGLPLVQSSP
jgi:hypothetical protein